MDANLPANVLTCTQCGGELHPDEGQLFLTCPYCSSAVYIDKAQVVFHWYLAPTLDESQARGALARWMAGNQTVKDLDQKSHIVGVTFEYFPMWYFKSRQPNGNEVIQLMPAAATAVSEITHLRLPAGDLRKYNVDIDAQATAPTVPLQAALQWRSQLASGAGQVAEQSLVHIPLYNFKYTFQGRTYTALVEGATGSVFANIYPAKAEAPYRAIGCITALVFLCLALIPIIGAASEGGDGAGIGVAVCIGSGLIAAPILFGVAAWIAAKV